MFSLDTFSGTFSREKAFLFLCLAEQWQLKNTFKMPFLCGAAATGAKVALGGILGPVGLFTVGALAFVGPALYFAAKPSGGGGGPPKKSITQKQLDGDMNSSEVAHHLNLGAVDTYGNILRFRRPFVHGEDGDKYYVEADHIPPLQSFRMARWMRAFSSLRHSNRKLHELVMSLESDPRGKKLPTVQVPTHHHRDALSSGSSRVSTKCRKLIARRIANGDVTNMLKQAFIIAHPYASQQIRDEAGLGNKPRPQKIILSKDRVMNIYRDAFLALIHINRVMEIIGDKDLDDLIQYVEHDMYLDRKSELYRQIVRIVRRFGGHNH